MEGSFPLCDITTFVLQGSKNIFSSNTAFIQKVCSKDSPQMNNYDVIDSTYFIHS